MKNCEKLHSIIFFDKKNWKEWNVDWFETPIGGVVMRATYNTPISETVCYRLVDEKVGECYIPPAPKWADVKESEEDALMEVTDTVIYHLLTDGDIDDPVEIENKKLVYTFNSCRALPERVIPEDELVKEFEDLDKVMVELTILF